jgi:CRP-like cAMP-binding protein/formate hydrogenlyase subunit 6/NADH:ubiquinone oxidoreductase subunit I
MSEGKIVNFEIDGIPIAAPDSFTIYDAARMAHEYAVNPEDRARLKDDPIYIPVLCHKEDSRDEFKSVGVCRVCCVMEGSPRLPYQVPKRFMAGCCRKVEPDMKILTKSPDVDESRRTLVELLLAEHPVPCARHTRFHDCELEILGERFGLLETTENKDKPQGEEGRYTTRWKSPSPYTARSYSKGTDFTNPSIHIDHNACVLCDRCVRACTDVAGEMVIGRMGKGKNTAITFDLDKPMGQSNCVSCGWCMISCPTGAITYNGSGIKKPMGGGALSAEDMKQHELFKEVSIEFLRRAEGGVVVKYFKKGEVICRQGEFGSTAFYIDSGKVDIFLESQLGHVRTKKKDGFFNRVASLLVSRDDKSKPRSEENTRRYIPIDAPVDLEFANPIASIGAGELVGEAACINLQPRSATVRAAEDTIVMEMMRNVLDILRRQKPFRADMDRKYRERALSTHLRTSEIFRDIPEEAVEFLRPQVELLSFSPGDTILLQGERADDPETGGLYLVRMGHVKVTETYADGNDITLSYLSRGSVFGEIGLLSSQGIRTATCTALDHVEVVRMKKSVFDELIIYHPLLRDRFTELARKRIADNQDRLSLQKRVSLQQYVDAGLYEAQSLLILDLEKCTRCDECVKACAQAHGGVTRLLREGTKYDKYLVTTSCRSCRDPLCMVGCPVGSIRRKNDLEIIIDDHCVGCGRCAEQCPYGNISMHPIGTPDAAALEKGAGYGFKATVCDLCNSDQCLTDIDEPACVYACPHDAAHRVDGQSFFEETLFGKSRQ